MTILGIIDTETDSLDPSTCTAVELAIKVYDTDTKTSLMAFSALLPADENKAEELNNIPVEALQLPLIKNDKFSVSVFNYLIKACDVLVAHNKSFDSIVTARILAKFGFTADKRWVCTVNEVDFPNQKKSKSLSYLALDHGIYLTGTHRALVDSHILEELIKKVPDIEQQLLPKKKYQAVVPYEEKDKAKDLGFRWDGEKKIWFKSLSEAAYTALRDSCGFELRSIDDEIDELTNIVQPETKK